MMAGTVGDGGAAVNTSSAKDHCLHAADLTPGSLGQDRFASSRHKSRAAHVVTVSVMTAATALRASVRWTPAEAFCM